VKRSRLHALDVLRAIAFLFVVAQHEFGGYAWREGMDTVHSLILSLLYVIAKPAVPIFLVLVGITLFLYSKDKKPNFTEFYRKKFKSIIVPYIFWAILVIYLNGDYGKFNNIIGTLITGDGAYHLWYMGTLIRIFLYFPLIWVIFNYVYSQGKQTRNILFTLFVIAYWLLDKNNHVVTTSVINFIFSNPSALQKKFITVSPIFSSLYLVIGIKIAYEYDNFIALVAKRKRFIIGAYPFLLAYSYYSEIKTKIGIQESNLVHYILGNLHQILWIAFVIVSILVFYILSSYIYVSVPKAYQLLCHISNYSYVGYLIHTYVLGYVAGKLSYDVSFSFAVEIAIYLVTILISIEIPHLLSYLPYSHIITGFYLAP
jgi:peptidoglycan/LPS O-acetylase OafA/YrhL